MADAFGKPIKTSISTRVISVTRNQAHATL